MKSYLLAAIIGLGALSVSACTVWENVQESVQDSEVTSRLVTNQMTLRFIEASDNPAERAEKVRERVETVRSIVDQGEQATLREIVGVVRSEIDWQSMSVADQELLDFALVKAEESLADLIGDGAIDGDDEKTIGTLLDWIDRAASRVE